MSSKSSSTTPQGSAATKARTNKTSAAKKSAADESEHQLHELIELLRQSSTSSPDGAAAAATTSGTPTTLTPVPPTSTSRKSTHASAAAGAGASGTIIASLSESALPSGSPSSAASSAPGTPAPTPPPSGTRKRSKNAEETRLDAFLLRHSKRYEFSSESYARLLSQLVESRLLNAEWERSASREHRLRVLRAIRVLSRDPSLQEQFLRYRPLGSLANALHRYTRDYFEEVTTPYAAESIVEVCSILKRVSSEESQDRRIFEQSHFLRSLVLLLSSRDHAVLQAVLVTLVNLSGSPLFVERALELPLIEPLLNILNEFSSSQGIAASAATSVAAQAGASTSASPSPGATPSPGTGNFSNSQPLSAARATPGTPLHLPPPTPVVAPAPAPPAGGGASYPFLAGELLDLLTEYRECRAEVHLLSGNAVFLRLLHRSLLAYAGMASTAARECEQVCLPVLRCLANQALEPESSREIRLLGGIQLLLTMISDNSQTNATSAASNSAAAAAATTMANASAASSANSSARSTPAPTTSQSAPLSDALIISACICLTQLALDDENAFHMRKSGAVHFLGMLFLRGSPQAAAAAAATAAGTVSTSAGAQALSAPASHPTSSSRDVQAHACRALRFLYSVERNRKVFKRLFPQPDLFAAFIDIGHYVHAIDAYERIVDMMMDLTPQARQAMLVAFETLRAGSAHGTAQHTVRGYVVQEVLGKGAFGTVYQVQRENGDKLYAMKELSLKDLQRSGGTPGSTSSSASGAGGGVGADAVNLAATEMGKEVEILSQLDHPNIVRYYTSFQEGPSVYIVMELVDGSSLLDHLNSWVEKGATMAEEAIWPIFIQLCLALCYMHMEKRVVHRDLTPSNIMINDRKVVKIADFGLARQTHNDTVLQSAVGTISYNCPEIVMHESYTDKADIWSLGCILYQMATGRPAFAGSNPLTVAQKIVSGSYTPLPASYSPLFHEMVRRLLTVDPAARPDILAVSSLISPLLMAELDRVNISHERLQQQLAHDAERHRREKEEWMREKQIWRKWMAATANKHALGIATPMPPPATAAVLASPPHMSRSNSEHGSSFGGSSSSTTGPDDGDSSLQPPSSSPLFRVSTSQLRPTSHDPLTLLLAQLHKLVFVSQLPPKSVRDLRRTLIGKYKHALFARPFQAVDFKRELQQIVSGSRDFVDASFELPHLDAASLLTAAATSPHTLPPPSTTGGNNAAARLTHEELQVMIEQVLYEEGYYAGGGEAARKKSREE